LVAGDVDLDPPDRLRDPCEYRRDVARDDVDAGVGGSQLDAVHDHDLAQVDRSDPRRHDDHEARDIALRDRLADVDRTGYGQEAVTPPDRGTDVADLALLGAGAGDRLRGR